MRIVKKESDYIKFEQVEIREPLVDDLVKAERIAGGDSGVRFALAVLSQIAEFDGKRLTPEDLVKLRASDFLSIAKHMERIGLEELAEQLSSSQKKQTQG